MSPKVPHRFTLTVFLTILLLLLWINYRVAAPYLLALMMGAILTSLSSRFYQWLCDRNWKPKMAAVVVTLAVTLIVIVPITLMGFLAISQAIETAQQLSSRPDFTAEGLSQFLSRWEPLHDLLGNPNDLRSNALEAIKTLSTTAPMAIFKFFGGVPIFFLRLFLVLISCYFFHVDGRRFLNWFKDKIPLDMEVRATIFKSFRETAVSTTVAILSAAGIQSAVMLLAFLVLNVPAAFLAAGITFFLSWVPILGTSPVWIGATLYLFANDSIPRGIAMLVFGVVCSFSDNIIRAWVLKGRGEIHPLVSLVAIFGGIKLFGILGVFIGPILAALLISVLNIWPSVAKTYFDQ